MPFPHRLIEGYSAFLTGRLPREQSRFRELAETGQRPEIMVIGCCDSRVSPEVIFDARPGRTVRGAQRRQSGAALHARRAGARRFRRAGIRGQGLRVRHIVVLGHAQCGGVRAFAEEGAPLSPGDFIGQWMKLMQPAAEKTPRGENRRNDYLTRLEQANMVNSLDNLMTFPRLATLIEKGKNETHGAYFGVATGELSVLDRTSGKFVRAAADEHAKVFAAPRF